MTDASHPIATDRAWRTAAMLLFAGLAIQLFAYWTTAESAVQIWATSSAYNHGYLIAPISLYLIWCDRHALRTFAPLQSLWGVAVVVAFGFAWLAADIMGINEGRHLAFVGMMQGIFFFALGWPVYRRMAFPLLYLWLMVPTGEFLVEPLQRVGMSGAVTMLNLFDIPVFTEGWTIEVPFGAFTVERGCSGLNFVLAALALSLLFGKLNYTRFSVRMLAVVLSIGVAIIANVIRIFLIVAITQWSERSIDIAEDHLLYGWIFFGIIMFAVMWWGMRYADAPRIPPLPVARATAPRPATRAVSVAGVALIAVSLAAFPLFTQVSMRAAGQGVAIVDLPANMVPWKMAPARQASWRPQFARNDGRAQSIYVANDRVIDVAVAYCIAQASGVCEAAALENAAVATDAPVRSRADALRESMVAGQTLRVQPVDVLSEPPRVIFTWYESGNCITASRLASKICAARQRIAGRAAAGAFVAISAEYTDDRQAALEALDAFASRWPGTQSFVRFVPR